jgi:NitT/TauT family transport system permease protein
VKRSALGLAWPPIAGVVVVIAAWWLATAAFGIREFFLPSPPALVRAFDSNTGYLLKETWATLRETLVGFALAAVAGLLIAMALSAFSTVERATLPILVALNAVPKVALAPLLVVWLGFGLAPNILMVALICFFPVVVSTAAGLGSLPAELGELSRSLSAPRWRSYWKVRLPWALPQVFVGLKVAVTLALIGAVVAEIANPNRGLGAVIVLSSTSLDTPLAFTAIALLAALSIGLFYLVVAAERMLLPWARAISA